MLVKDQFISINTYGELLRLDSVCLNCGARQVLKYNDAIWAVFRLIKVDGIAMRVQLMKHECESDF